MKLKAQSKKILEPGIHLVTIKGCSVARGDNGKPASWIDHEDKETPRGAIRMLFMGKNQFGIEHDFWLGKAHLPRVKRLAEVIGVSLPVHKDSVIGKKLFVLVAKVLVFDGDVPRLDGEGKQVSFSKLIPQASDARSCYFWGPAESPSVAGNPADDKLGNCSGDFLWHFKNGKYTVAPEKLEGALAYQAEEQMGSEGYSYEQINRYLAGDESVLNEPPANLKSSDVINTQWGQGIYEKLKEQENPVVQKPLRRFGQ